MYIQYRYGNQTAISHCGSEVELVRRLKKISEAMSTLHCVSWVLTGRTRVREWRDKLASEETSDKKRRRAVWSGHSSTFIIKTKYAGWASHLPTLWYTYTPVILPIFIVSYEALGCLLGTDFYHKNPYCNTGRCFRNSQ